jgi:hypothetical protein
LAIPQHLFRVFGWLRSVASQEIFKFLDISRLGSGCHLPSEFRYLSAGAWIGGRRAQALPGLPAALIALESRAHSSGRRPPFMTK